MTEIDAYFYQHQIIVKRGKEYKTGEVLLAYLSRDFGDLTALLNQCKHYSVNLHYPETRSEIRPVNLLFRQAHNFFSVLYQLIASLPPYDSMPPRKDVFDEMREKYEWLINMSSDGKSNDCVPLDEIDEAEDMDRVLQFDAELKALIEEHQTFLEDLLRVQKVFAPFLELVHHRSEFLSNEETAAVLDAFTRDTDKLIYKCLNRTVRKIRLCILQRYSVLIIAAVASQFLPVHLVKRQNLFNRHSVLTVKAEPSPPLLPKSLFGLCMIILHVFSSVHFLF